MNTTQVDKVLSKHVKYFQGVYPIDLLTSTLIKPSIIIMNLGKHYIPSSHWVVVCISDYEYAEYFDSYGFHPTSSKSMHNCNANQYLGHSTATGYRDSLRMSAITTAASTPSTEPGEK